MSERTVRALRRHVGRPYVWGGEGELGLDCSGLVRRALVEALVEEDVFRVLSFKYGNFLFVGHMREAAWLWWHDASVAELGQGYQGRTFPIGAAASVRAVMPGAVAAGDLAVTLDGVHVMSLVGNGTWIAADPEAGRVVILDAATSFNPWLDVPVRLVRWSHLAKEHL